ncbi:PAM68 family protein [Leptolyngbya sp. FACHB-261]|uniref:PAM68 family protein n=1 Tax=Leptolyngbya sp. FACHB-261 TaxID=2692806 RepID=UPI001684E873|nr:PAM68 family protein [Leptolyngbya sp. FACHB-261]MBD2104618.1 PAM68 family protein [Leptolyngbya sp. FACHB-261]
MTSDPESGQERVRLPFEPGTSRKKRSESKQTVPVPPSAPARGDSTMPKAVSDRIVRRVLTFCGVPTLLGFSTFLGSYGLIQNGVAVPNAVVLLLSMAFLGLGVLGLSYGAISASWDEGRPGSKLGWDEFRKNFGYLTEAWKGQKS